MLTKQANPEDTIKCHLEIDATDKLNENMNDLIEKNALVISSAKINVVEEDKVKIALVKARKNVKKSKFEKITEKLYDLEPRGLPEKQLNIDLDLYQMEDY